MRAGLSPALSFLLPLAPTALAAQLLTSPSLALGGSVGANALGLELEARPVRRLGVVARADGLPIADYPSAMLGLRLDVVGDRFARLFIMPAYGAVYCPQADFSGSSACRSARWHATVSGIAGAELALSESGRFSLGIQGGYMRVLAEPAGKRLSRPIIDAVIRVRLRLHR